MMGINQISTNEATKLTCVDPTKLPLPLQFQESELLKL